MLCLLSKVRDDLEEVEIESVLEGDHYDPQEKKVRIVKDRLNRKSIQYFLISHSVPNSLYEKPDRCRASWKCEDELGNLKRI